MSRILLLIDNYPEFKKEWEIAAGRAPFYQSFMRVLGEGRPLGVHAVITADRSGSVPTAVFANIPRRVVMRLSDPSQYVLVGAPKDVLNEQSAPGRAVVDKAEVQLAVLGGTTNVAEQTKALDELVAQLRAQGAPEVGEIGALPTKVSSRTLPAQVDGQPVFGIADDTLAPRGFEPIGSFIVTGPPQSGKTNVLKALVESMERFDPEVKLFHLGSRRAMLSDFRPWVRSATRPDDEKTLVTELAEIVADESFPGRIMIVAEDMTHLADGPADRPMRALLQAINNSDHLFVGDADVTRAGGGSGVMGEWKAARQGIVLKPDTYDGDTLFKVPFGKLKRTDFPAGRGIFVQAGRTVTMQMPLASDNENDV
jgi:S-DNA-T family DNA segregation ATPase FtsK/SpoIIIE